MNKKAHKKMSDEQLLSRYKDKWSTINFIGVKQRDPNILTYQCKKCHNILQVKTGLIYEIDKNEGKCKKCCYTKKSSSHELIIPDEKIKEFLKAIYFKNISFFEENQIVYNKILKVFNYGKLAKKESMLLFNEFFKTDYSTKKLLFTFRVVYPEFIDDSKVIGDSSGNSYYPLDGYIKRGTRPFKIDSKVVGSSFTPKKIGIEQSRLNPDDFFTITEVESNVMEEVKEPIINNSSLSLVLEKLIGEHEFKNMLIDKISTLLSEQYTKEILSKDLKIQ